MVFVIHGHATQDIGNAQLDFWLSTYKFSNIIFTHKK